MESLPTGGPSQSTSTSLFSLPNTDCIPPFLSATNERFEERKQCFIDQYGNYTIMGPDGKEHHINSAFTDGEDTADAGGLAQAYKAWTTRRESDPKGEKHNNVLLPGLGEYTREQLFFIGKFP